MIVLFFERGDEMSISSTVKKIMPYIKTTSGYVLHRLSSQAVEMDDGTTLEEKVTALNNLISQKVDTSTVVNNLLTTEAGFVLDARQGKTLNDSISELSSKLEVIKFTLTSSSVVSINAQNCYYEPLTRKVHIEAALVNSDIYIPSATELAKVPEIYKPLEHHNFPATFEGACGRAAIYTDAVLRQYTSNVQHYMYISTDYFI